jgi:hypothetical protein
MLRAVRERLAFLLEEYGAGGVVSRYCTAIEPDRGGRACDPPRAMDAPRGPARESSGAGGVELEPATMLPAQLYTNLGPDASLVPEKRLLLAVLEDAVVTFQRYAVDQGRRGRRLFREAEEWVVSEEASWPCSFRNICDVLGLDPSYLRHGLRRWRDRHRANPDLHTPHRHPFRRLSGSRTRAIGRPIGLGRYARRPPHS